MKKSLLTILLGVAMSLMSGNLRASVVYTPMNLTASQTATWNWFGFGVDTDGFGLWVNIGASLRLETYQGKVIGTEEAGMTFLTEVPYGTEIGAASAWVTPALASYINDATHVSLNGKTVYVGVQLTDADAKVYNGWMKLVVSEDGLTVTLVGMAYQDEAGASLMAGVIDRQVYYQSSDFMEDLVRNDGTIGSQVSINLEGVDFSIEAGPFVQGTQYTVANLPAGLTMEIRSTDSKHAVITLSGKASAHAMSDAITNLTISFMDAAFNGVPAAEVIASVNAEIAIKFFDPYQIIYEDLADLVCTSGGWAPFENLYFGNSFGLWHDGTDMRIETYGKSIIGTSVAGRSYFTPIDEGTVIDGSSAWVNTGNWPDEPFINTATFTTWNGKHKYAGIQLVVGDAVLFGWINLEVSADGKTMTIFDWAFNTQPNGPIKAGQMTSGSHVSEFGLNWMTVYPNPVRSQLMISVSHPLTVSANLDILDISGKRVHQEKIFPDGSMSYQINTQELQPGIYLIRVNSTEINFTGKIIRE